jgi:hypothetical protein
MWSVDVLLGIEIGMILKIRFSACYKYDMIISIVWFSSRHRHLFPHHLINRRLWRDENSSEEEEESQTKSTRTKLSAKVVDDTPTGIDMNNPKCGIIDPNK